MMKTKKSDKLICLGFCLFFGSMLALFLLLPEKRFSANEKRYLAPLPTLRLSEVLSGRFGQEAETYAADHLPGRDFFVGLNARYDLLSGRQVTKEIYVGKSGRLYEAPAPSDEEVIEKNMAAINDFAGKAACPVDLMLVPSAGYLLEEDLPCLTDPYRDEEILNAAYALAASNLSPVDLLPAFASAADKGALFYRTDHHWTSEGAYLAYATYLNALGRSPAERKDFTRREMEGFLGSTYSRAALWDTEPESLSLWDSGERFLVENGESKQLHEGLFYEEHLSENDKYPVYLDGNHSLVRIRRAESTGQGKILVIRDSFAHCFGCFLAESYDEVVLVDLRYYRSPVSQLLEEGFDRVLILYSIGNFMTDANIVRLD